ncbi:AAA family ATPase [Halobacterium salinarum]|uniref:AAA family ATPase n=1 Tax=Halobacterium salinarum TaxID=2242 RepID=UPI0025531876|nr:AAA family ATPase [Halobacterium salinarum]MDL0123494.1 AAA family ATPase [Halobacterium salinarum]MDL0130392.1 AAA family ATPase [Halobacterium salinarum]
MEILSLEISNYRQYIGTQKIDLATSGERNLNIIEGQNGAGKSNILNAITLCFYGRELHQETRTEEMEQLPMVSEPIIDDLSPGESESGHVKIELGDDHPEYIFERNFTTYRVGSSYNDDVGELQLQRRAGNQYTIVENPNRTLTQILPSRVKDYFLFDGEALSDFFDSGYKSRVKDAIIDVSHIGLLNNSVSHLETVKDDIRRKATDFEGRPQEIQEEIDAIEQTLSEKRAEKAEKEGTIQEYDSQIEQIKEKLRGAANDRARELVEKRERLEEEIKELKAKRETKREEADKLLNKAGPAIFAIDALEYTREALVDLEEKGQLPPKIQDWFIEELIEEGECICGRNLSDDEEARNHLRNMLENTSNVSTDNLEGKAEIPRIIRDGNDWARDLRQARKRIRELSDEIEVKDKEFVETKAELEGFDVPDEVDVSELSQQQDKLEGRKSELIGEVARLEGDIESKESTKEKKEKEFRKEAEKQGRHNDILAQVDFADSALDDMEEIRARILNRIRDNTEENLNQYFNELIWKDEEYDITLTQDYGIEINGPESSGNRIGSLSAGESQVLALSFMAALSEISGFRAPIVIDTPLGRIASENRKRISQNLPSYLEDTQITFLMTDTEYDDDVRGRMKHRVANEYLLDFDGGRTEVIRRD